MNRRAEETLADAVAIQLPTLKGETLVDALEYLFGLPTTPDLYDGEVTP